MCFKQGVTNLNGSNHQKELKLFLQRCEAKDLCFSAGFVYTRALLQGQLRRTVGSDVGTL